MTMEDLALILYTPFAVTYLGIALILYILAIARFAEHLRDYVVFLIFSVLWPITVLIGILVSLEKNKKNNKKRSESAISTCPLCGTQSVDQEGVCRTFAEVQDCYFAQTAFEDKSDDL